MNVDEQKLLVRQFLERCNEYADAKLAGYEAALARADAAQIKVLQQKIDRWTTYREFNEHAIGELAAGELDAWFANFEPGPAR